MKRNERSGDQIQALLDVLAGNQSGIWTALPCQVAAVQMGEQMTISAQPLIQGLRTLISGAQQWVRMPLLLDCPVVFPMGGPFSLTFPIAVGDECLVVFSSRCIDAWWQQGGVQPQADLRMHDLSDGFAIMGVRNKQRRIPSISTTDVELRNEDGSAKIAIAPDHRIKVNSDVEVVVTAPLTTINGNVNVNGNIHATGTITGDVDVIAGTISGKTHRHSGVTTGPSNTGTPV